MPASGKAPAWTRSFNGAAHGYARKSSSIRHYNFITDLLQRSRARLCAEIVRVPCHTPSGCRASTEPRTVMRGNPEVFRRVDHRIEASTEPRTVMRGNVEIADLTTAKDELASTEPRTVMRGNSPRSWPS